MVPDSPAEKRFSSMKSGSIYCHGKLLDKIVLAQDMQAKALRIREMIHRAPLGDRARHETQILIGVQVRKRHAAPHGLAIGIGEAIAQQVIARLDQSHRFDGFGRKAEMHLRALVSQ